VPAGRGGAGTSEPLPCCANANRTALAPIAGPVQIFDTIISQKKSWAKARGVGCGLWAINPGC
jgi:hypothetical protein